jgi:PEGA domain
MSISIVQPHKGRETMSVEIRPSKARGYWFIVLAAVLFVLFLETNSHKGLAPNLLVNSSDEAAGAKVTLDGREVGQLQSLNTSGLSGSGLWTSVGDGQHEIQVQKDGFAPYKTTFNMHTEAFVAVDLKLQKN